MIIKVPNSLLQFAKQDIENFIRDIANITERGAKPFFRRIKKINEAVKDYPNPFNPINKTFSQDFQCQDKFRRYMHIDLATTKDAVGISMAHVPKFEERELIDTILKIPRKVLVPHVYVDFWGKIRALKRQEIVLYEIRDVIYDLSRRGFYFGLITFDKFQSIDSIQTLRTNGYTVGHLSVDRTTSLLEVCDDSLDSRNQFGFRKISTEGNYNAAHGVLKDLIYDNRVDFPNSKNQYDTDYLVSEIKDAQETKTGKVDHPPSGSIDVEQSVAGSAYHCVNNEKMIMYSEDEKELRKTEDTYYSTVEEKIDSKLLNRNNYDQFGSTFDPRDIITKYG